MGTPMSILKTDLGEAFTPQDLWEAWSEARLVVTPAPLLRHEKLLHYHRELLAQYPDDIQLEEVGYSFQGRVIQLLKMGVGRQNILFWSQMHGDEPSATPALLDIANYLLCHSDHPVTRSILENYTLLMIPMLNPDGAEVYERCNAQGIDINRDALRLATPEGRLLKQVREDYKPVLGLNLHDQERMTTVGNTGRLATASVLAVAGDNENTLTIGRLRTKRACAAIAEALGSLIPGGIARYDETWNAQAFGDHFTAAGTPVVLVESGGLSAGYEVDDLTRLNFVALISVLKGLAEDDLASFDPQVYEDLPDNQADAWSDVVVRGGLIMQAGCMEPYRGDLAFNYLHNGRQAAEACGPNGFPSEIFLVGDASHLGAGTSVNAHGKILLPAFAVGVKGWPARHWLDRECLARLAALGVGCIHWHVDEADYVDARRYADGFDSSGISHVEVVTGPEGHGQHVLTAPPSNNEAVSLSEILGELGVVGFNEGRVLDRLWTGSPDTRAGSLRLRKDQPASFLLFSPSAEGRVGLASRLVSVWLDGHQVI